MFNTKKGQSAASAAVLLVIIVGLMIMFIILIPPAERYKILEDSDSNNTLSSAVSEKSLVLASPGKIDYLSQKELEHPLPVVNLFSKVEAKIVAEKNLVSTKRALLSEKRGEINFVLNDYQNTNNALLTFKVKNNVGNLRVFLNGEEIFNDNPSLTPISLPKVLLKKENQIVFASSSPGMAFWATNEAILEKVQIIADVINIDAQTAKYKFIVSETERNNIERVRLKFQPTCNNDYVGRLIIRLNGNEIYSAIPDCDLEMIPIEFSENLLYKGENEVIFFTESGNYVLSYVNIITKLKELEYPTYYFELSKEQYDEIKANRYRLRLQLDFVDIVDAKYGDLIFNGHLTHFDTREVSYAIDLGNDAELGNNALKLIPKKTLDVRQLKIELFK